MTVSSDDSRLLRLRAGLLGWYDGGRRDLPWRHTRDPYRIWVSEIMCQQTQVATVIPYYERFLALFPTVSALAAAPTEQVLKAWEGLGYYSRARHLQAGARLVCEHHDGVMPQDWEGVRRLPGVGDYTAGAILSIAFGVAVPAVDGNVIRVTTRLENITDDVGRPATKRAITAFAAELVDPARPGDLNQALMELGATVCTPTSPKCPTCPVAADCQAHALGGAEALPVKVKKTTSRAVTLGAALVRRNGRYLIVRRPDGGIWGGLWGFPAVEVTDGAAPADVLEAHLATLGLKVKMGIQRQVLAHTLTHRQLTIPVYEAEHLEGETAGVWASPAEMGHQALPVPFQKVAASLDYGPLFGTLV